MAIKFLLLFENNLSDWTNLACWTILTNWTNWAHWANIAFELRGNFDSPVVDECDCHTSVVNCIEGTAAHQGAIDSFTEKAWSLVEEAAVQNANDTNAQQKERTRAWIRYQQCR